MTSVRQAGIIEELTDSKTFKASRPRRVNDIEFRINVLSIPKTASASKGVLARVMTRGSKCSAGLAFQALRLSEVFCLLQRNSASLVKNGTVSTRGMDQPSPSSGRGRCRKSKILLGPGIKKGPERRSKANRSHEINDLIQKQSQNKPKTKPISPLFGGVPLKQSQNKATKSFILV